jgi:hypothetical protein
MIHRQPTWSPDAAHTLGPESPASHPPATGEPFSAFSQLIVSRAHTCPDLSDNDSSSLTGSLSLPLFLPRHFVSSVIQFPDERSLPCSPRTSPVPLLACRRALVLPTIPPHPLDPTPPILRPHTPWSHRKLREAIRPSSRSPRAPLDERATPSRALRTTFDGYGSVSRLLSDLPFPPTGALLHRIPDEHTRYIARSRGI